MNFFGEMSDKVGKGLDWGKAVAKDAYTAAANKTEQAKKWVEEKAGQAKDAAGDKVHSVAREQAKKAVQNKDLLNSIDRRKDFTSKTVQDCPLGNGPPVQFDGFFLGKDCSKPTKENPKKKKPQKEDGHKPKGCENCGKDFPQTTFTNGIDNSLKEACATIQQLSNDLCMEVIGVYNASYKDATPPPRSAEESMALLKAGAKGAGSGALDGMKDGVPDAILAGVATGGVGALISLGKDAGKGALKGAAMEAGKEGLKQQASRWVPQSQDALRVIETLNGSTQSRAMNTMADDIANSLRDGQQVNLIGHSEGGVNTVAAIAQAKAKLADEREDAIRSANPNLDPEVARVQANREVESNMAKNMNVTLLGTQQTGLPDGPNYMRIANNSDLVPDTISGTQDAIGRPGHDKEPISDGKPCPAVERFSGQTVKDKLNPIKAHSMSDSYIPYMRGKTGRAKGAPCC